MSRQRLQVSMADMISLRRHQCAFQVTNKQTNENRWTDKKKDIAIAYSPRFAAGHNKRITLNSNHNHNHNWTGQLTAEDDQLLTNNIQNDKSHHNVNMQNRKVVVFLNVLTVSLHIRWQTVSGSRRRRLRKMNSHVL